MIGSAERQAAKPERRGGAGGARRVRLAGVRPPSSNRLIKPPQNENPLFNSSAGNASSESDAAQSLKESYAAAQKSGAYQKAAAKGAELETAYLQIHRRPLAVFHP